MINFKAHLIDSTQIKEKYNEKYIDKKVNLIELNPKNKQDMFTLKEIGADWNYGYSLAKEIHTDALNMIYSPKKTTSIPKFYALTKQMKDFKTPKINDILALAEILPDMEITVITNAHDCVVPLMNQSKINLIATGGKLDRFSHSYGGMMAWTMLRKFSIDKAFFSCNGIDIERGASEVAESHAEFKENVLPLCSERILLCYSTKFGIRSTRFFADMTIIDRVITDSNADPLFLSKLADAGKLVS